jgi:hypothetical protein
LVVDNPTNVRNASPVQRVAISLPLLGAVGALVLVGWKLGPWPPLGITAATALLLAAAWRWARPPRQIEGDPSAVQRWRDERTSKIGYCFGALTGVWLAAVGILLVLVVIAALLAR